MADPTVRPDDPYPALDAFVASWISAHGQDTGYVQWNPDPTYPTLDPDHGYVWRRRARVLLPDGREARIAIEVEPPRDPTNVWVSDEVDRLIADSALTEHFDRLIVEPSDRPRDEAGLHPRTVPWDEHVAAVEDEPEARTLEEVEVGMFVEAWGQWLPIAATERDTVNGGWKFSFVDPNLEPGVHEPTLWATYPPGVLVWTRTTPPPPPVAEPAR
jgi:hypothetical protein